MLGRQVHREGRRNSLRFSYELVDVFTDRPFAGNPLAVFPDAADLTGAAMQAIARELNLSETTFVVPSGRPGCLRRVRIFTPATELPMAGHPTIGTAFVLDRAGLIDSEGALTSVTFEVEVGPVPVSIFRRSGSVERIEMSQPQPRFGSTFEDVDAIGEMLSIDGRTILDTELPVQAVSCGVPFLLVPVPDLGALESVRLRRAVWEAVLAGSDAPHVFVFTRATEEEGIDARCRMFAPALGIEEDPATGGASGPLGCYLVMHSPGEEVGSRRFVFRQGVEIGRPSTLFVVVDRDADRITGVRVGGRCAFVGSGFVEVEERFVRPGDRSGDGLRSMGDMDGAVHGMEGGSS